MAIYKDDFIVITKKKKTKTHQNFLPLPLSKCHIFFVVIVVGDTALKKIVYSRCKWAKDKFAKK